MKKIMQIIVSIIALTVMAPGHADETQPLPAQQNFFGRTVDTVTDTARETLDGLMTALTTPWIDFKVSEKDQDCLARNIYYEAASEPEEGKAAVGIVTINRVKEGKFGGNTICAVVNQRTVYVKSHEVASTEIVQTGWFGRPESVTKKHIEISSVPICQFSWVCQFVRRPKVTDERWQDSLQVAQRLLNEGYVEYRVKYNEALYFHSAGVRPVWANQKRFIARIGGHKFYRDIDKI